VQIDRNELAQAEIEGIIFQRKSNDEIAIGFRPDMFMAYATNAQALHRYGRDARMLRLLNEATQTPPQTLQLDYLAADRQRVVREVSRLTRAADFRQRVLFAYGNRCAITRVQLRLIDAAHILPVGAARSSDSVTNGLCLSPTYHRAFDAGLIYLDEDFRMQINLSRLAILQAANLAGGLDTFRARLGERIFLPPDPQQRPGADFIRRANRFRQITT
jgi:putative restriction endonuclease